MANDIHVVPAGEGWAVEATGGGKRTMFATQEEAISAGTARAKQDKVELLIHGRDGQIRERNSFGHDPATSPASRPTTDFFLNCRQ